MHRKYNLEKRQSSFFSGENIRFLSVYLSIRFSIAFDQNEYEFFANGFTDILSFASLEHKKLHIAGLYRLDVMNIILRPVVALVARLLAQKPCLLMLG